MNRMKANLAVAALVAAAMAVGALAVWLDPFTPARPIVPVGNSGTDTVLVAYRQSQLIPTGFQEVRALAAGSGGKIYVAGDDSVAILESSGKEVLRFPAGRVTCLAVGRGGNIYAGVGDHVEVFSATGKRQAAWPSGPIGYFTSIAVADNDVFVADYASRTVIRYDMSGKERRRLDGKASVDEAGFIVPSPYFDLALANDGLLRVANPGRHRIEAYTFDGRREFSWGEASQDVAAFTGCCNPAHFAMFRDGRIVTSEKGLARVKVFRPDGLRGQNGELDAIVAGGEAFGNTSAAMDVAVDTDNRVLVLDPNEKAIRVFTLKAGFP